MIYCLTGKIIKKTLDSVVISCGGVGYFVQIPATTGEALPPAGQATCRPLRATAAGRGMPLKGTP